MIGRTALATAVASEGVAIYVVAEWFAAGYRAGHHHATPAFAFASLALLAFYTPRLVQWFDLRPRASSSAIGLVAFVAIYGVMRVQFGGDIAIWDLSWMADFVRDPGTTMEGNSHVLVGTVLLITIWGRGSYRSSADVELEALPRAVGIPFIVVTGVIALSVYTERAGEVARAGAAYYVLAVISLALGQLSLSGASFGDLRAGGTVAMLLAGTIGAAIACVAAFWIVFGLVVPVAGPWLERALFYAVTGALWPVAWTLDKIFGLLFGNLGAFESFELPEASSLQETAERDPATEPNAVERGGIYASRILMLVGVLGGIALLVAWLTRLRNRARRQEVDGASTGLAGAFSEDLRGLFGAVFRRDRGAGSGRSSTPARKLYLEVLERASGEGVERQSDETPMELAPRLSTTFHTSVTDEITAAFLQSRYAGREPDPRVVAELERRWRLTDP